MVKDASDETQTKNVSIVKTIILLFVHLSSPQILIFVNSNVL